MGHPLPDRCLGTTTRTILRLLVPISEHRLVYFLGNTYQSAERLRELALRTADMIGLTVDPSRVHAGQLRRWYRRPRWADPEELRVFVDHIDGGSDEADRAYSFAARIDP